ncbi:MAG: HipA domain-containing protein [Desulfobacula sp.]|uniref:type II toxin-antitoxin system HipA family toxin n=1 Tax=Desulfobacula sp. TaxID=2593537 RepID=UPI0025C5B343|nr:HipA domain-containing protein [Desulfobacula sp.]MCD4721261.1 HipA domain-containing protein [Desulfobacula sp.]
MAGAYGYEQVFGIMRSLKDLGMSDIEQQHRRIIFNVIARNQDDHTKNISFLMASDGRWKLSPAYDVTYSYNHDGLWTNQHQMTLNGKRDNFTAHDLIQLAEVAGITDSQKIIHEVLGAVERWLEFARETGVQKNQINAIASVHRGESINNSLE